MQNLPTQYSLLASDFANLKKLLNSMPNSDLGLEKGVDWDGPTPVLTVASCPTLMGLCNDMKLLVDTLTRSSSEQILGLQRRLDEHSLSEARNIASIREDYFQTLIAEGDICSDCLNNLADNGKISEIQKLQGEIKVLPKMCKKCKKRKTEEPRG